MTDARGAVMVLRRTTRELAALSTRQSTVAAQRRDAVAFLRSEGWSLQRIADAIGVTKSAVQKMV